ncbi:GvpL/GvpF family gas vesicle protein, partial [Candidatus Woesearchaeota archaeon]|nr:GvpL/GvpF family gas vesicle protein [Candidatus Woesearchaeota archaeon]
GENSAQDNLKKWLNDNKERLEKMWNKIESKKEYGIRIYYDKEKLVQEVSSSKEIGNIQSQEGKSIGLSYLLQSKAKDKINEIMWNKVNELKNKFYSDIKKVTTNLKINPSRIFIDEEKDLLLSLSILVDKHQSNKIRKILMQKAGGNFSIQLAGPFAPYSFVNDENDRQR